MKVLKEIAQGILAMGLIATVAVVVAMVSVNSAQPGGPEVNPVENSSANNETQPPWWDTHDLNALPGLENTTLADLPTVEEVENALFNWNVFENGRPPLVGNWTGSFDFVLSMVKMWNLEYHLDGDGNLHVDTPGFVYETPTERDGGEYMIGNFVMENGGGSRNALDFARHLSELGIANGIAIFEAQNACPEAKVVVPVRKGLMYSNHTGGERGSIWTGIWHATNVKPGENNPWSEEKYPITGIDLHWRLGEGDYVEWNYILDNCEPTMVWPENGEPVDWRTPAE